MHCSRGEGGILTQNPDKLFVGLVARPSSKGHCQKALCVLHTPYSVRTWSSYHRWSPVYVRGIYLGTCCRCTPPSPPPSILLRAGLSQTGFHFQGEDAGGGRVQPFGSLARANIHSSNQGLEQSPIWRELRVGRQTPGSDPKKAARTQPGRGLIPEGANLGNCREEVPIAHSNGEKTRPILGIDKSESEYVLR